MIRHARMRGHAALFLPGLDHASIAAQFVMDGILAKEGESRQTLGRERYLERMREFVAVTREVMLGQQRRVGASADWGRLRFTMDDGSAKAVRTAFERLYREGHAYRTEALVNWCPGCRTSVSDLEVIPTPETGTLWSVRYHLLDAGDGTSRMPRRRSRSPRPGPRRSSATRPSPSTRTIRATRPSSGGPCASRSSIATCRSSRTTSWTRHSGPGAVKITPAHDHDDRETGLRHGLAAPTILADDATVTGTGTAYDGLDRYEARRRIVADLEAMGDLGRQRAARDGHRAVPAKQRRRRAAPQDPVVHPDGDRWRHGRCASTREGRTRILPDRFEKTWEHWMTTIRDWNVSRQLWWGHRIPAWYCPDGHVTVSAEPDGPRRVRGLRAAGVRAAAGPGHLRHLVQLGPLAVLDARLAGRHGGPGSLLPDIGHGDRLRHHLLLGRPDDDAGPDAHGPGALPHGLPVRA